MFELQVTDTDNHTFVSKYDKYVDSCPFCHSVIKPIALNAYLDDYIYKKGGETISWVIYKCPRNDCGNIFIGYYRLLHSTNSREFKLEHSYPVFPSDKNFSIQINNISPEFVKIFNQAYSAEQHGLKLVAGPGYRKSLEYLIKDYARAKCDENGNEEILKKPLGETIKTYIDDSRIKSIAQRAVWLGNDETHYLRRWEGKDLDDLKILIELTVHWIEMVELSNQVVQDMPEN